MKLLPNGLAFIRAASNTAVNVYDIQYGTLKFSLKTDVMSMENLENGYFATSGTDMQIKIWDLSNGNLTYSFKTNSIQVSMKQLPIRNYLASGSSIGKVFFWNLDTGSVIRTLNGHQNNVIALRISSIGKLISGASDGSIIIWDILTGASLHKINPYGGSLYCLSMLNGDTLYAGSYINDLFILKINQTNQFYHMQRVRIPGSNVYDFGLTGEDTLLVAIGSGLLLYYNTTNFQLMGNISVGLDIYSIETSKI